MREQVRRNKSSLITLTFRSKFLLNQSKPQAEYQEASGNFVFMLQAI